MVREILFRLTVKDQLKELKRAQNLYASRDRVEEILCAMQFPVEYVRSALTMYEVMAEMFEISSPQQNIYDLEVVAEMVAEMMVVETILTRNPNHKDKI